MKIPLTTHYSLLTNQVGQLYLEALISITLIAFAGAVVTSTIGLVNKTTTGGVRSNQGVVLEEGFEVVQAIAKSDWNKLNVQPRATEFDIVTSVSSGDCGSSSLCWKFYNPPVNLPVQDNAVYLRKIVVEDGCRSMPNGAGSISGAGSCSNSGSSWQDPALLKVKVSVTVVGTGYPVLEGERYFSRSGDSSRVRLCAQTNWNGGANAGPFYCWFGGGNSTTNFTSAVTILTSTAEQLTIASGTSGELTSSTLDLCNATNCKVTPLTIRWKGLLQ